MTGDAANQPDFSKIFFDYFATAPRPISYEIRKGPNQPHDVHFMSSLLHDACFKPEDIKLDGRRLTLLLRRDRWEDNPIPSDDGITCVAATLTIEPVLSSKWEMDDRELPLIIPGPDCTEEDLSLWMTSLAIQNSEGRPEDEWTVILVGWKWRFILSVGLDGFGVRLQDAE